MPGSAFAGGVTVTSPSYTHLTLLPISGMLFFGVSIFVNGDNSSSPVCGTVTGLPAVVFTSSYPGVSSFSWFCVTVLFLVLSSLY
ncbi:hypothetical protein, partial [Staphylococcus felis]|uniref:hypothetical protein n=1 Tax=Staphylococcus felis TaxID=46127 RepID=UPI001EE883F9